MRASVVIPVWNGASVIVDCLQALYSSSGAELLEVICVDNASSDDSSTQIKKAFPQVRLIQQPINLGFAGGVNAGIDAAQADVFVLLNQDCIVQSGWLSGLLKALLENPQYGIMGCTILNEDDTINHTGAFIHRPDAVGVHITDTSEECVKKVDYASGAAIAIKRSTWDSVGRFDDGFYPAYYEDADYCYRARRKGIETACAITIQVKHLLSSREWQEAPFRHAINSLVSRYRFVCKHFDEHEIGGFFEAEYVKLEEVNYLNHVVGRIIASLHSLRHLPDILERRRVDVDDVLSGTGYRQLQVGFAQIKKQAFIKAGILVTPELNGSSYLKPTDKSNRAKSLEWSEIWKANALRLQEIDQREFELLTSIYFRDPTDSMPGDAFHRLYRLLFKRLPSLVTGREATLRAELNNNYRERINQLKNRIELVELMRQQTDERLKLLELITEYDYWYR